MGNRIISSHVENGVCKTCGESMVGDGYKNVIHCPNANADFIEPDANAVHCVEPPDSAAAKQSGGFLERRLVLDFAKEKPTLENQQVQRVGRGIRPTEQPFKIDWVYVAFFTLVLFVGLFGGYGLKTQCKGLADNVYIKCSK